MTALIVALVISLFTAGCGGNTTSTLKPNSNNPMVTPVGETPVTVDGDYLKIGMYTVNGNSQPEFFGSDNSWEVTLPKNDGYIEVSFYPQVAGVKRSGPGWDYEVWVSKTTKNWNDPEKDLATFNKKICTLKNGEETQSYLFLDTGRFLVKAYEPGTTNQVDFTYLNINRDYSVTPIADLSVFLTVSPGEVVGEKEVTVILKNNGGDISNVIVSLANTGDSSIIARAGLTGMQDFLVDSGSTDIGYGMIFMPGSVVMTRNDVNFRIGDSLLKDGYIINDMMAGETIVFDCIYQIDQFADAKGITRNVKK